MDRFEIIGCSGGGGKESEAGGARTALIQNRGGVVVLGRKGVGRTVISEGQEWGIGYVVVGSAFGAPQIFASNHSPTLQNKGFGAFGL